MARFVIQLSATIKIATLKSISLLAIVILSCFALHAQTELEVKSIVPLLDCNDVYGYAAEGREYAIVGQQTGTSIVELTDPYQPEVLHFIPGPQSTWRDMKTWQHYAYVVNEESDGLLIIDMQNLPGSINSYMWDAGGEFSSAHNIFIDENGFAYLIGHNNADGSISTHDRGAMIVDLNESEDGFGPTNPKPVGAYLEHYIHDAFVRADTMWAAEIYEGTLTAVDVSDKENPFILSAIPTPSDFAHACWPNDDTSVMFTADEKEDSYVAAYDVSDVFDMQELDRYQSSPGEKVIPHNLLYLDERIYISYYTDGVRVLDVTRPDNLVEVGYYDTSIDHEGPGYKGCWGVYPLLPSTNILAADRQIGLYILGSDNMPQGAYLSGTITDATSGQPINQARVDFVNPILDTNNTRTNLQGQYKTAAPGSNSYEIIISAPAYISQQHTLELTADEELSFDTQLERVPDAPVANFTFSNTTLCNGEPLQFSDTSFNSPNQWQWQFEGGTPSESSEQNPSINYTESGTYEVTMTSANFAGENSLSYSVEVVVDFGPTLVVTPINSPCPGDNDGTYNYYIDEILSPEDQVSLLLYKESGQQIAPTEALSPGNYVLKASINAGCFSEEEFTIEEPPAFEIEVTVVQPTETDLGSIAIGSLAGGTPPYEILWNDQNESTGFAIESLSAGIYSLNITDSIGCKFSQNYELLATPLSIDGNLSEYFDVYPIPSGQQLHLNSPIDLDLCNVSLVDMHGREVSCSWRIQNNHQRSLNLSHLAEGIYLMRIQSPEGSFVKRITVAR